MIYFSIRCYNMSGTSTYNKKEQIQLLEVDYYRSDNDLF